MGKNRDIFKKIRYTQGTFHGEGDGTPLQYSCLENSMDGEAWWATVHRIAKSQTQLSHFTGLNNIILSPKFGAKLNFLFLSTEQKIRPRSV